MRISLVARREANDGTASFVRSLSKYAIVSTNPARSWIFGSHPKTSLAFAMSGWRCRGSSEAATARTEV